jgi:hypothetical protein
VYPWQLRQSGLAVWRQNALLGTPRSARNQLAEVIRGTPSRGHRKQTAIETQKATPRELPPAARGIERLSGGVDIVFAKLNKVLLHIQRCGPSVCVNSASSASMVGRSLARAKSDPPLLSKNDRGVLI